MTTLHKFAEGTIDTDFGPWRATVFHDGHAEAIVLSLGDIYGRHNVMCRIHSECVSSHVLGSVECDCRDQMINARARIADEKAGLVIYLKQEGRGNGAVAHIASLDLKRSGRTQSQAYKELGFHDDARDYLIVAKVLEWFHIDSIRLLSANHKKRDALASQNITVSMEPDHGHVFSLGRHRQNLLAEIQSNAAARPFARAPGRRRMFVVGDLNLDYVYTNLANELINGAIVDRPQPIIGGTAFNAAVAYQQNGYFVPLLFGKVGRDAGGEKILTELQSRGIGSLVGRSPNLPTGECLLNFARERGLVQERQNANDYDIENLKQACEFAELGRGDWAQVVGHLIVRETDGPNRTKQLLKVLKERKVTVALDLVPHDMPERLLDEGKEPKSILASLIRDGDTLVNVIIAEYRCIQRFLGSDSINLTPTADVVAKVFKLFPAQALVLRFGHGNASQQDVWRRIGTKVSRLERIEETGYSRTEAENRRGFGDRLTADVLQRLSDELGN